MTPNPKDQLLIKETHMTKFLAPLAVLLALLATAAPAGGATRPVTVSARSSCDASVDPSVSNSGWRVDVTIKSTTARTVDVYSDSDYGLVNESGWDWPAGVTLKANVARTVTVWPGSYAQRLDLLIQPHGKPYADPLAQTYVFPYWVTGVGECA